MCSCSEHGIVTGAYRYPVQRQVTTSLVGASVEVVRVRLWRIDDLARMSPSELYLTSKRHQSLPFCAHLSCKNFLSIWVGLPVRLAAPAIFHQLELFSKPLELQTSPCNCLVPELDLQLSNFVFLIDKSSLRQVPKEPGVEWVVAARHTVFSCELIVHNHNECLCSASTSTDFLNVSLMDFQENCLNVSPFVPWSNMNLCSASSSRNLQLVNSLAVCD